MSGIASSKQVNGLTRVAGVLTGAGVNAGTELQRVRAGLAQQMPDAINTLDHYAFVSSQLKGAERQEVVAGIGNILQTFERHGVDDHKVHAALVEPFEGSLRREALSGLSPEVRRGAARSLATEKARGVLAPSHLKSEIKVGVISSLPFEALFNGQKFRRGELKANEYAAEILSNSIGFGAWTIGGALGTAALMVSPLGPALATGGAVAAIASGIVGFATGMTAQHLFDKSLKRPLSDFFTHAIPEGLARPFAIGFTKLVANPLTDWVWKPLTGFIKKNKKLSIGIGGALALRFPALGKTIVEQGLTMAGGTVLGMAITDPQTLKLMGTALAHKLSRKKA